MRNPLIPKKPTSPKFTNLQKSAGILDDYAVRRSIDSKEGTVLHTPTEAKDIVNKEYVDDQIANINDTASRVSAKLASNDQVISHDTLTVVVFDTEEFDNLGEYDTSNGKFTAKNTGYYIVGARVMTTSTSAWQTGEYHRLDLYKNGSYVTELGRHEVENGGTLVEETQGTQLIYLEADDYIEIKYYQNSNSNMTLFKGAVPGEYCYLYIHRLS